MAIVWGVPNFRVFTVYKGEWVQFQGKQLFHFYVCLPSHLSSTLKEKNLLPCESRPYVKGAAS